jgi:hypothetical protein
MSGALSRPASSCSCRRDEPSGVNRSREPTAPTRRCSGSCPSSRTSNTR